MERALQDPGKNGAWILVTGASRGIGRSIAATLIAGGNRIIGVSRSRSPEMEGLTQIPFDLRRLSELSHLWEEVMRHADAVAAVVLNAGVGHIKRFVEEGADTCMEVMTINFMAPYLLAREAVAYWQARQAQGHLIFIGSQAGLPGGGQALNSLYSASKASLHSLVSSLSRELGPLIRVNAVAPGDVLTDLAKQSAEDFVSLSVDHRSVEEYLETVSERSTLRRWVAPSEIADAVKYLLHNEAVTGTILNVSAGTTIY